MIGRQLAQSAAGQSVRTLGSMRLIGYPVEPLAARIRQLATNMTPYDAAYVALAETLAIPFFTRDGKLSRSAKHQADIRLI